MDFPAKKKIEKKNTPPGIVRGEHAVQHVPPARPTPAFRSACNQKIHFDRCHQFRFRTPVGGLCVRGTITLLITQQTVF